MMAQSINRVWTMKGSQLAVNVVREFPLWSPWSVKRCLSVSSVVRKRALTDFSLESMKIANTVHGNLVESSKTAKGENEFADLDKPIQFTTSKAAQFTAEEALGGDPFPNSPWYQPYVVSLSVGIFLLYFCVLREENDIDEEMELPLWQRIPGLEKQQLQVVLDYNRAHNLDTTDIERRMKELEMAGQQAARK